ncbi:MAG: DNA translocase FtsK 4TM domain-containing protein [Anaerolineales bacterium]|nr:DNA translocase FtsK 4TM domain-containing protein [Anaerolineales bacterium]
MPTQTKRPVGKKTTRTPAPSSEPLVPPDSRLDILGVGLAGLGLLTLIFFFAAEPETLPAAWVLLLRRLFGLGAFLAPLIFAVPGVYLILRRFRAMLPVPAPDRIAGIAVLFLGSLMLAHLLTYPTRDTIFLTARDGNGGGYTGALLLHVFLSLIDYAGTVLVLAAWLLVGILLAFRVSIPELIRLLWPVCQRLGNFLRARWQAARLRLRSRSQTASPAVRYDRPTAESEPVLRQSGVAPAPAVPSAAVGESEAQPHIPPRGEEEPVITIGVPEPPPPWALPAAGQVLNPGMEAASDENIDRQRAKIIEDTLESFGASAKVVEINRGPTITQFGVEPGFADTRGGKTTRIKVSKIAALSDDIALALAAPSIRIQAPVPGKGFVGIEVPNAEISLVGLRDVVESDAFRERRSPLRIALGKDVSGRPAVADLAKMPHLLIAGTTGSGKSVCVNAILACYLLHNTPDDLRLLLVDPKRVELTSYNGIPHLLAPVVVELERVVGALQWVTREMDERYRKFSGAKVRNLEEYNRGAAERGEKPLPVWVVVIDELADLMLMAPDEVERILTRIGQLSRATGIHMIIATQRPSVDVLTGLIKANIPARIAFAVASQVDSRVILDQPGAEKLLGRGDMLFQSPDSPNLVRLQGAYVSEPELMRLVQYWRAAYVARQPSVPVTHGATNAPAGPDGGRILDEPDFPMQQMPMFEQEADGSGEDKLIEEAIAAVRQWRKASTTRLQRHFRIGYTRAARLMDQLEERGIIGPPTQGSQPREVIDYGEGAEEEFA